MRRWIAVGFIVGVLGVLATAPAQQPPPGPMPTPTPPGPTPNPPAPWVYSISGAGASIVPPAFAVLSVNTQPGDQVKWQILPAPVFAKRFGDALAIAGKPGDVLAVVATIVNFKAERWDQVEATLTFAGTPTPPVPPGPQPGPNPPGPKPVPGVVKRFVVVEDTSQPGAWRGDILGSTALAAVYKQMGLSHRLLDINGAGTDPVAQAWVALAKGKTLPYLWTLDGSGIITSEQPAPKDPTAFIAVLQKGTQQEERKFGNIDPGTKPHKYRWVKFGDAPNVPVIPRGQWKPVNLNNFSQPIYDQDGRGQCNCSATCTAVEIARAQAGLPYVHLSAGDLYSQINGGTDQGSLLEDGLATMISSGVATAATVPYVWDGTVHSDSQTLAERKLYRVSEAYVCPTFDAMASAIQQGFVLVEGLMWGDNFTPDRDGWLPAPPRGRAGGHALCGCGLVQRGGTWGIYTINSWTASWGINGTCVIPENDFGSGIGGWWAIRVVNQTSDSNFPAPKTSLRDAFRRDKLVIRP